MTKRDDCETECPNNHGDVILLRSEERHTCTCTFKNKKRELKMAGEGASMDIFNHSVNSMYNKMQCMFSFCDHHSSLTVFMTWTIRNLKIKQILNPIPLRFNKFQLTTVTPPGGYKKNNYKKVF